MSVLEHFQSSTGIPTDCRNALASQAVEPGTAFYDHGVLPFCTWTAVIAGDADITDKLRHNA
jgi:hypothetical protein